MPFLIHMNSIRQTTNVTNSRLRYTTFNLKYVVQTDMCQQFKVIIAARLSISYLVFLVVSLVRSFCCNNASSAQGKTSLNVESYIYTILGVIGYD